MLSTEDVNAKLAALSYSPISDEDHAELRDGTEGHWDDWVLDASAQGKGALHYDDFRSALMALSVPVSSLLQILRLNPPRAQRIKTFLREGKGLRGAVVTHMKEGRAVPSPQVRAAFIMAFAHGRSPLLPQIERKVHRIYASTTAVTFECATAKDDTYCLQVEAAARADRNQTFDWSNKIIVQLRDTEVLQALAVLQGYASIVEFAHHGTALDKRVTLKAAPQGGYLISVRKADTARVVPIPAFEAFKVASLALRVLDLNSPHLGTDRIIEMCRQAAGHGSQKNQD